MASVSRDAVRSGHNAQNAGTKATECDEDQEEAKFWDRKLEEWSDEEKILVAGAVCVSLCVVCLVNYSF